MQTVEKYCRFRLRYCYNATRPGNARMSVSSGSAEIHLEIEGPLTMFETTVVESRRRKPSSRRYSSLPISILLHLLVAAGALVGSVWTVRFPGNSPAQIVLYSIASPPPPMPPPPPPPAGSKPTPVIKRIPRPTEIVAPTVIPEEIPIVESISSHIETSTTGVVGGVEGGVEGGVMGGVMGGELDGELGGVVGAVAAEKPKGPLRVDEDVKLPRFISQVFPEYPEKARWSGVQGTVVVDYVIGKDGKVRQVTVITEKHPLLAKAAVEAIRRWRFRPTVVNGEPVEVVHKLAIIFELQ